MNPLKNVLKTGYYASLFLAIVTLITFGFAMTAIPVAGEFCPQDCSEYPYLDTVAQFPKDFIWMYLAQFVILLFLVFMLCLHYVAAIAVKIYSHIGLVFAMISGTVLLLDLFIQSSVVPASLMNNETEGLALLIQYNPHGVFIAMEELGYLLMGLSLLFMSFVFSKEKGSLATSLRLLFLVAFAGTIIAFVTIILVRGVVRNDLFEVMTISINWFTLIVAGFLASKFFRRKIKSLIN